jgi:proton-dependent oligopeptide transporter, POT family
MSDETKTEDPAEGENTEVSGKFGRTFWMLNCIEMFERLAYFALRVLAPIYIAQASKNPGGLHLKQEQKGWIYGWWFVFQSLLPIVTGGFSDRYGYKKILTLSFTMNITGYLIMAFFHSYYGFFAGVIILATGTALFKPSVQGSLANSLNEKNTSMGWGIFYWVVNVGAVISHYIPGPIVGDKTAGGWRLLFLVCAGFTAVNYLMLLTYKDVSSGAPKTETAWQVLKRTIVNVAEARLIAWLLIMSCFWLMMYQLWDLQPNFIEDWIDSSAIAAYLQSFPEEWHLVEMGDQGVLRVPQQILISLNAISIVALVVPVSWLVRKMRTLSAMLIGMLMATAGLLLAGLTSNVWFLLLGIFGFSLGEMLTGPKKQEYLGIIAPPGKKGMYLGYVNIPVGIGGFFGSIIAGKVYGSYGEKATLSLKYLMSETDFGRGKDWDGKVASLEDSSGVKRTESFAKLQEVLGLDGVATTRLLWKRYRPHLHTWIPFAAIGGVAAIALYIFGRMAKRWKDMNA